MSSTSSAPASTLTQTPAAKRAVTLPSAPSTVPAPAPLSTEQRRNWRMPFTTPSTLRALEFKLRTAANGTTHVALFGDPGVGKTELLKVLTVQLEQYLQRELPGSPAPVVRMYEASRSTGQKGGLLDMYRELLEMDVPRLHNGGTASFYIDVIAKFCIEENVRLVAIDEAQLIDAVNLDLIRQVADRAKGLGHPMGLCFSGHPSLRQALASAKMLGQRLCSVTDLAPISHADTLKILRSAHPDLELLATHLSDAQWRALGDRLAIKAGGNLRRIATIIGLANEMAVQKHGPITAPILDVAIGLVP